MMTAPIATTVGKIAGSTPRLDECEECGKQVSLTVLDRNAAENDGWVCDDCAGNDKEHTPKDR